MLPQALRPRRSPEKVTPADSTTVVVFHDSEENDERQGKPHAVFDNEGYVHAVIDINDEEVVRRPGKVHGEDAKRSGFFKKASGFFSREQKQTRKSKPATPRKIVVTPMSAPEKPPAVDPDPVPGGADAAAKKAKADAAAAAKEEKVKAAAEKKAAKEAEKAAKAQAAAEKKKAKADAAAEKKAAKAKGRPPTPEDSPT